MKPETQVQLAIMDLWRRLFHRNEEILLGIMNGVHLTPAQARMAVAMGLYSGASDLVLIRRSGLVLWIEVKRPALLYGRVASRGGIQEGSQISFQKRVNELGHDYVVVDNTDQFLAALEERGVRPVGVTISKRN